MPDKNSPHKEKELPKEDDKKSSGEMEASDSILATPKYKVEEKQVAEGNESIHSSAKTDGGLNTQPRKITSFSQLDNKPLATISQNDEALKSSENKGKILSPDEEKKDVGREDDENTPPTYTEANKKKEVSSEEIKEWLSKVRPEEVSEKANTSLPLKVILPIIVILAIIGALLGGIYYYKTSLSENDTSTSDENEKEITAPTQSPQPTESEESEQEEVNLEEFKVNVLNGSGIAGEAGNAAELLENEGFGAPKTGNAKSYDFTTTQVELKETVPESVYNKVKDALSENYIVEKSEDFLDDASSFDIVITVGTKKN